MASSVYYIIGGLVGFALIGLLAVVLYYNATKKKYAKNTKLFQKDQIVVKNKTTFKDLLDRFYQFSYLVLVRIPIIKHYTRKTRLKLEMVNEFTEYEIRKNNSSRA